MLTSYEMNVNAPVELVFSTAIDVAAMPLFTRDVESMVFITPAPLQLGSQVRDTRRLLGLRRSQLILIPLFESPSRFIATFDVFGITFSSDHLFYENPAHTRFLITVEVVGTSGIGRILRPFAALAAAVVRHGIKREIEDIKVEAERRAREAFGQPSVVLCSTDST
jgi:hypothetical protein